MNLRLYNWTIGLGILLIAVGVGFFDWRCGLISAGALVLAIAVYHFRLWMSADVS